MAESESVDRPLSYKYRSQATLYRQDKDALIQILDSLKATTDEVEEMLSASYKDVQNDYFTNQIKAGNEDIVNDISDIKTKLESVSHSLDNEAERLDRIDNNANVTNNTNNADNINSDGTV